MADFYIQTDKNVYFAGETVNGQIFINISAIIIGAQGLSLKFTGYQCVKWIEATQLRRPANNPKSKVKRHDPIAAIPKGQLHHQKTNTIQVSEVESEDDRSYDHRPKYIKTPANKYYRMKYFQTRNMFAKNKSMIYQCNGFAPGQYSFPFSFKTFEGWPASFQHKTQRKKGVIVYHITAAIQPTTKQFQLKHSRQITLRQTRLINSQHLKSQAQITSCCCLNKGITSSQIHFEKDGYVPGQLVQMIMQIDNTNCTADITTIGVSIQNQVKMRSNGSSTVDRYPILGKSINGVPAGQKATENNAIRQAFNLQSTRQIKPTCSGKLLSNSYSLSVMMNHDISCDCCSNRVGVTLPIIIFPFVQTYAMPNIFQNNWVPQNMPMTNLALVNNFENFQLSQMQEQVYPPMGQYPGVMGNNGEMNATEEPYQYNQNQGAEMGEMGDQFNQTNQNLG